MAGGAGWVKSKRGGFTLYSYISLGSEATTSALALNGASALISSEQSDIKVHTADSQKDSSGEYVYEEIITGPNGSSYTIPRGAHMLKVEDVTGGSSLIEVYVEITSEAQGTVDMSDGIGADPS
jgi:hypothetical protein